MAKALCAIVIASLLGVALSQDGQAGRLVSDAEAASLVGGDECNDVYATECTGGMLGCSGGCGCDSGASVSGYRGDIQDCPNEYSGCSIVYKYQSACCVPCSS